MLNEVQAKMDTAKSSAENGKWKSTREDGSVSVLLESGDLRDAIETKINGNIVEIGVYDSKEVPKAYAHVTGYKGHPHIPQRKYYRQFIPNASQKFSEDIMARIDNVIELAAREGEQSKEVEMLRLMADESLAADLLLETRNQKNVTSIITNLFGDIFDDEL